MTDQEKQFVDEMVFLDFIDQEVSQRVYVKNAAINLGITEVQAGIMLENPVVKSAITSEIHKYQAVINGEETKEAASRAMWDALKTHVSGLNQ